MSDIGYLFAKMKYILNGRNIEVINKYFRKKGIDIGENSHIFSNISNGESYLIHIGNNVTISNNVSLITHDSSISKAIPEFTDFFGEITIDDNCFIGMNAIVLPGVHICENVIVAAGAVIVKSIDEPGTIWGGIPARMIGTVQKFGERYREYAVDMRKVTKKREKYIKKCKKIIK